MIWLHFHRRRRVATFSIKKNFIFGKYCTSKFIIKLKNNKNLPLYFLQANLVNLLSREVGGGVEGEAGLVVLGSNPWTTS